MSADEDFLWVADKGEQKIQKYANSSLKFRGSNIISSPNEVAYVPKLRYNVIPIYIMLCDMDLASKERFGTYLDIIK